jgi:hypothetical protein
VLQSKKITIVIIIMGWTPVGQKYTFFIKTHDGRDSTWEKMVTGQAGLHISSLFRPPPT